MTGWYEKWGLARNKNNNLSLSHRYKAMTGINWFQGKICLNIKLAINYWTIKMKFAANQQHGIN